MLPHQQAFLEFAIKHHILRFGQFTLKSGRKSPYFFDAGLFNSGNVLAQLGRYYADAIQNSNLHFDILFGPAYKGIPLVTATAIALAHQYQLDIPYCFNRKEIKNHGEGGNIVGAPLQGRVLLIDDVISAGTAIREAVTIIQHYNAQLVGVVVALNRQERGQTELSAIEEIEAYYHIPVISIVHLDHLIEYLTSLPNNQEIVEAIQDYRRRSYE